MTSILNVLLLMLANSVCSIDLDSTIDYSIWKGFKKSYKKTFKNFIDEILSFDIWKNNLKLVTEHNMGARNGKHTYIMELNDFADMANKQIQENSFGLFVKDDAIENLIPKRKLEENIIMRLPDFINYTALGYVTPVKSQKRCSSCYAFIIIGALEGQYYKKYKKLITFSEQEIIDCSINHGNRGCNGGNTQYAINYVMKKGGVKKIEDYPYVAKNGTCRSDEKNIYARIANFSRLPIDEYKLQDAVVKYGPIPVAIDASKSSFRLYKSGIYYEPNCNSKATKLNHGVLIVGYGTENGVDYWLCKNSWGKEWGENGYIKMSRNRNNNCGIATYAFLVTLL